MPDVVPLVVFQLVQVTPEADHEVLSVVRRDAYSKISVLVDAKAPLLALRLEKLSGCVSRATVTWGKSQHGDEGMRRTCSRKLSKPSSV